MEIHKLRTIKDFDKYQNQFLKIFIKNNYIIKDLAKIIYKYYIEFYYKEIDELILPINIDFNKTNKHQTIFSLKVSPGWYKYIGYLERDSNVSGSIKTNSGSWSCFVEGDFGMEPLYMRNTAIITDHNRNFEINYCGSQSLKIKNCKFIAIKTNDFTDENEFKDL